MATHSSTLAWRIPWREESGRLQPMGSQRVRHHKKRLHFFFFSPQYTCLKKSNEQRSLVCYSLKGVQAHVPFRTKPKLLSMTSQTL